MIANGISWTTFGILYGALAAAVVLVYLLRMARRGRAVSSTLIWQKVMGTRQSLWKELISLLVQLTLLLLVCLALVDPRPPAEDIQRRWVALVFDASESMSARDGDAARLRLAEREAWKLVSSMAAVDRAMVVSASVEVDALTPFTGDREELKEALAELDAKGAEPKLGEAIAYALGAFDYAGLGPNDTRHLFVFTDRPEQVALPESENLNAQVVPIGSSVANIAITSFDVRKTINLTASHDVLIKVRNFSDQPVDAELAIFTPDHMIGTHPLSLPGGGTFSKVLGLPFGTDGKVTALLRKIAFADEATDALPSDNAAFAFVPPVRRSRVVLVTNKNLFLYNALALNPEIDLMAVKPGEYHHGLSAAADVAVFDRFTPPEQPTCSAIYFYPSQGGPFAVSVVKKKPAMTGWADGHPVLRHVQMDTLYIESSKILKPQDKDVVLMGHYDGALMLLRVLGEQYLLGIGFDLAQTDFPLQAAFPIFMHNVIHVFSRKPEGEIQTGYRIGQPVDLAVTTGRERVVLLNPLEQKIAAPVRLGRAVFRPAVPGFYSYADADAVRVFAASLLDEDESNLTVTETGALTPFAKSDENVKAEAIRPWLLLAALLLAAFDMVMFLNGKLS